jgi:hypothetical protein
MKRFADLMLETAFALFGMVGAVIAGYTLFWLLTSPTIKAMVFGQ